MGKVLDEAKATGRLVESIQSHDQPLDLAALAEQLVDLFLGCEERQVADIEGGRIGERVLRGLLGLNRVLLTITTALELSRGWVSNYLDCAHGAHGETSISSHPTGVVGAGSIQPIDCTSQWRGHFVEL